MTDAHIANVLASQIQKGTGAQQLAEALLVILHERGERARVPSIIRALDLAWKNVFGVSMMRVTSAHTLGSELQKAFEQWAKGADLVQEVDPALIGGASVRIDDRIIDASIAGRIQSLKTTLS